MSHGSTDAADYTQFGFGPDAVYFTANMFNNDGNAYVEAETFEANKKQMEAGSGAFTRRRTHRARRTPPRATHRHSQPPTLHRCLARHITAFPLFRLFCWFRGSIQAV
jgi:hypothetical protein